MKGRILWPTLGVLTVFTYNTWLLWRPLNGDHRIFDGYLSELSASDQPHNAFFRGGDLITAVIVLALGVRALHLWRRRGAWWTVAAAALLLFGVSTFLDAFFAMDCSPILNDTCRVAEEAGRLSTIHYAHTFTSVGAQAGIVASMVATAIAMLRSPRSSPSAHARKIVGACAAQAAPGGVLLGRDTTWYPFLVGLARHPPGRRRTLDELPGASTTRTRAVLVVAAVEVLALTVMLVMIAADVPGLGYPQAVMVVIASLWFAAIGIRLVGPDAGTRRDPALSESDELVGDRG